MQYTIHTIRLFNDIAYYYCYLLGCPCTISVTCMQMCALNIKVLPQHYMYNFSVYRHMKIQGYHKSIIFTLFSEDHQPFDSLWMPWAFLSKCFAHMTYLSISHVALSDIWSRSGYMYGESKLLRDSHINHIPLLGPYVCAYVTIHNTEDYTYVKYRDILHYLITVDTVLWTLHIFISKLV